MIEDDLIDKAVTADARNIRLIDFEMFSQSEAKAIRCHPSQSQ
jgi:hypothetical protein